MSSTTRPTTQIGMLLVLGTLTVAALTATGIGAQTAGPNGADREPNFRSLRERGDIRFLPAPLQDRLLELARRPHSYLEPKPGLPTDPDDSRAFVDMFTDISGLFVVNNESGWYEGWMLYDLRVPPVAAPLADGRAQFGTMTPADAAALAARGTGNNVPGHFFTLDGNAVRFSSGGAVPPIPGNTVGFSVSTGTFNAQQQGDVHGYWEFNRGTNWVFPHYELPFTGGLPGTFPALQYGLQSVISDRAPSA